MKQLILGTAGHIDHGKTALVRALTGVDCDRLKEERRRGITIELGFAPLSLPSGQVIGIVDVPGHERFVRQMVAGAMGIDMVMLVVAADEGIMPQTREHLEICHLLGIQRGLVALNKADLVDQDWLAMVQDDVAGCLSGTFLAGAAIIPASATTGQGIADLAAEMERLAAQTRQRSHEGIFRLPIDRVFTMKGFGTVVTGTAISGHLRVGEQVSIYPSGMRCKVRGLQVHNRAVETALAGQRAAANLQGVDKQTINRGEVAATAGALENTYMLNAFLAYLPAAPRALKPRDRVRLHLGTAEVLARVIPLEDESLQPGQSGFVQLRLDSPVAALKGDRFVVRSYSPVRTVGGGEILNPLPHKLRRARTASLARLKALRGADDAITVVLHAEERGQAGIGLREMEILTAVPRAALTAIASGLAAEGRLVEFEAGRYAAPEVVAGIKEAVLAHLNRYHAENPLRPGAPKEALKGRTDAGLDPRLIAWVLADLASSGAVAVKGDLVTARGHVIELSATETRLKDALEVACRAGGLTPPTLKESTAAHGDEKRVLAMLRLLVQEGRLAKVNDEIYYHTEVLEALKQKLTAHLKAAGDIGAPEFKQLFGVTRKFMIPLLEYLDAVKLTIRVGDRRRLRER
ncbi:MAG: selenocysteine-specific translation elongation factor [Pseudomonadota bacterium]